MDFLRWTCTWFFFISSFFHRPRKIREKKKSVEIICSGLVLFHALHTLIQASDNGNVSISILSFTPTREDNGKVLICRAINEVMKHSIKETTLKLNIYCKYFFLLALVFTMEYLLLLVQLVKLPTVYLWASSEYYTSYITHSYRIVRIGFIVLMVDSNGMRKIWFIVHDFHFNLRHRSLAVVLIVSNQDRI